LTDSARAPKKGTMRALRAHERGESDGLVYEEAPDPVPGIGDVLVRVHAASFTPTELHWPSSWVDRTGRDRRPIVPGHEVSGVVTALGYGTSGIAIGDAVYGLTDWYRDGAAAEYVAVEARNLAPKPPELDHGAAAAVPMAGLTTVQALFDHGRLMAGQTVLILGAGGGVGAFAVQVARAAGARVVASARGWARELVQGLGAHAFVDADRDDVDEAARAANLVFDLVGGEALARSVAAMRDDGTVVSVVEKPQIRPDSRGPRALFFVVEPNRAQLVELGRRITAGELRPVVGAVMPVADGRAAFAAKQRGTSPGKLVLQVAPGP
jgi:NADPH:quinone reductase-like Zn-dependent oxidoreductase